MGLLDFAGERGQTVLHFNWDFATVNGVYGVQVNESYPLESLEYRYGLTRQGVMVFYMKTWQCPTGYDFFNLTTN